MRVSLCTLQVISDSFFSLFENQSPLPTPQKTLFYTSYRFCTYRQRCFWFDNDQSQESTFPISLMHNAGDEALMMWCLGKTETHTLAILSNHSYAKPEILKTFISWPPRFCPNSQNCPQVVRTWNKKYLHSSLLSTLLSSLDFTKSKTSFP